LNSQVTTVNGQVKTLTDKVTTLIDQPVMVTELRHHLMSYLTKIKSWMKDICDDHQIF